MPKRKICVITGTRAEYGLLSLVLKQLKDDSDIVLQLVVTGMHLSPEFGLTYKQIIADGFEISKKLEILLSSDTSVGITKSIGLANISFADAFADLQPDIIVLLGDRFEVFAAATAALIARIPVAHIHGGELTEGAFDDALRHSITKMSHIHFTATDQYRNRVINLGEHPSSVYRVGALGVENVNHLELLDKSSLESAIDFKLKKNNLLVTFHPVTLEESSTQDFQQLLDALDELQDTGLIFTMPNADTNGRALIGMIRSYVKERSKNAAAFESLGHIRYLSALQYVDGVVGNSSSGLIEAPSFKIGTINIGDRQRGRTKAASVIDCAPDLISIRGAFDKLYSSAFQQSLPNVKNPYQGDRPSVKICEIIKMADLQKIIKKSFYDTFL